MFATTIFQPFDHSNIQRSLYKGWLYSQVCWNALNKAIAPWLINTTKDLSHYTFLAGQGCGRWVMELAGIQHNPVQAAAKSAWAELTTPEALATYQQLRNSTREALMDGLIIGICGVVAIASGVELAQSAYRKARHLYGQVQRLIQPAAVPLAIPQPSDEAIAAIVAEIQGDRFFQAQMDQIHDAELATVQGKVDQAMALAPDMPQAISNGTLPAPVSAVWNPRPHDVEAEVQYRLALQVPPVVGLLPPAQTRKPKTTKTRSPKKTSTTKKTASKPKTTTRRRKTTAATTE